MKEKPSNEENRMVVSFDTRVTLRVTLKVTLDSNRSYFNTEAHYSFFFDRTNILHYHPIFRLPQ